MLFKIRPVPLKKVISAASSSGDVVASAAMSGTGGFEKKSTRKVILYFHISSVAIPGLNMSHFRIYLRFGSLFF
jgi:hypothetical protein